MFLDLGRWLFVEHLESSLQEQEELEGHGARTQYLMQYLLRTAFINTAARFGTGRPYG